jgi:IS5 family transposase
MLRTVNASRPCGMRSCPEAARRLPPVLVVVDELLDDPGSSPPFGPHFSARLGRPSIPIETNLRMMFVRYRYKLGFETLCAKISHSIAWRRFGRVPLDAPVSHPTTLLKIRSCCGPGLVEELNEALLAKAAEAKLVRADRVCVDSAVTVSS